VECDPKQIEQVIRNIILNAVQAMPDGGTLSISAQQEPDGERVTLRFCDTGVGVTEDRMEVIFQPFFTTKTKGTGLGLAIVRKIVEKHGGLVNVSSRVGEGTCFAVTLPVQPPPYEPLAYEPPKDAPRESPVPLTSSLPDA
jgi:signal transduction histidine kinase